VNYTATTSAGPGTLPLAASNVIVFPAGVTTERVTNTPTANPVSGPTLTITLTVLGSSSSGAGATPSGTAFIANSGAQLLSLGMTATPSMYRGLSNDFATFYVLRYGDTNYAASYTIPTNAFTITGTATAGVDYLYGVTNTSITVNQGDVSETVTVSDPVATGVYHGNESIIVGLNNNAPVPVTSATTTMTLVDNADPAAPILFADPLTNPLASVNWTLTFANTNLGTTQKLPIIYNSYPNYTANNPDPNAIDDFDVEFGYAVTNDGVGASPEMLLNGWTNALKMTVNKNPNYISTGGCSAGVNVYPVGMKFSGNYALRFSMNFSEGVFNPLEYDIFGINHHGTNCNWFAEDVAAGSSNPPYGASYETNQDGIWYWIGANPGSAISSYDYAQVYGPPLPNGTFNVAQHFTALTAPYTNDFKNPVPYNVSTNGAPVDGNGLPANSWADVEVKQVNNVITLSINKFPIMNYVNTTNASSGNIMLGYDDPYSDVGAVASTLSNPGAAVYYSDVRVVQLTPPNVTSAKISGSTMTITFTDSDTDDTSSSFEVLSATTVNGTYTVVPGATFTQLPSGAWQTTVTVSGPNEFFDIARL
jgi:hypothetical protein